MTLGEQKARTDAELRAGRSSTSLGIVEDYDWGEGLVLVNVGGATQWMGWAGPAPWKGNRVRISYLAGTPIAQPVYGSAMGTFVSESASIGVVTGDDGTTYDQYVVAGGLTLTAGDRVALLHSNRLIIATYPVEPPGSVFNVPTAPPGGAHAAEFRPTASGSYKDGVFRGPDVEVNEFRVGAYWYGTQIKDSIPDGATITKAELRLSETYDNLPGVASLIGTHTQAAPSGQPTISGSIGVTDGGTVNILSLANALKTGPALGIGFQLNTGWRGFASTATSGTIYMEWS